MSSRSVANGGWVSREDGRTDRSASGVLRSWLVLTWPVSSLFDTFHHRGKLYEPAGRQDPYSLH